MMWSIILPALITGAITYMVVPILGRDGIALYVAFMTALRIWDERREKK